MDKEKRRALEEDGWVFGDAEDFLELTPAERDLVALRTALSRAVRNRRIAQSLTQAEAAKKLKSSQSRVAKLEAGSADVSLDLMFRGLFELGGSVNDIRVKRDRIAGKLAGKSGIGTREPVGAKKERSGRSK
jgi:predicted XRE-type DNA-binding protein